MTGRVAGSSITGWVVAAALLAADGAPALADVSNRIVAVVGEDVITEADVASHLAVLLDGRQAPLAEGAAESGEMREAVLDRLIEQRLVLQEAKRRGLTVSSDEVVDRVEVVRRRFGSDEALRQSLAEAGISREQFRQQVRDQLLAEKAIDAAVRSKIRISPHELAQAVERQPEPTSTGQLIEAWHLLVRVNPHRTEADAKARMEEARRALAAGEPFAAVARRYSDDANVQGGGALGWVAPGVLMPELDRAIAALKEGEISEPIRSRLGFHLVRVGRHRTVTGLNAAEMERAVEQRIFQEKFQAELATWLGELKRKAYIELRPDREL